MNRSNAAAAPDDKAGRLLIDHPVIRMAGPLSGSGAGNCAGFWAITNSGAGEDRLVSVTSTAANRAVSHGQVGGRSRMQRRARSGGVPVLAGPMVPFAPGGLHVMFIGPKAPVRQEASIKAQRLFEEAVPIDVEFKAEAAGGSGQR